MLYTWVRDSSLCMPHSSHLFFCWTCSSACFIHCVARSSHEWVMNKLRVHDSADISFICVAQSSHSLIFGTHPSAWLIHPVTDFSVRLKPVIHRTHSFIQFNHLRDSFIFVSHSSHDSFIIWMSHECVTCACSYRWMGHWTSTLCVTIHPYELATHTPRACCIVLQCVAVHTDEWATNESRARHHLSQWARDAHTTSVLQCIATCCSVLQCVAVRCSVLQCVAVSARDVNTTRSSKTKCTLKLKTDYPNYVFKLKKHQTGHSLKQQGSSAHHPQVVHPQLYVFLALTTR